MLLFFFSFIYTKYTLEKRFLSIMYVCIYICQCFPYIYIYTYICFSFFCSFPYIYIYICQCFSFFCSFPYTSCTLEKRFLPTNISSLSAYCLEMLQQQTSPRRNSFNTFFLRPTPSSSEAAARAPVTCTLSNAICTLLL